MEPVVLTLWDRHVKLLEVESASGTNAVEVRTGEPSGDGDSSDIKPELGWTVVRSRQQRRKLH